MFRSVHDHSYGRNRALTCAYGAEKRRRGFHVDRDRAGCEQIRPFVTADDVIRAGQRPCVDGTPGHGPCELFDEEVGPDARNGSVRIPGLLGDDQIAGVHPGGEPGTEAGGQHGCITQGRVGQQPGDGPLGRLGPHAGAQNGDRTAGAPSVARAQGEVLDAERAGDQQRGRGGLCAHQPP